MKRNAMFALLLGIFSITQLFPHYSYTANRENTIYHDKKNGYFIFAPPKGWITEEYSDPRSKVAFHNPEDHEVYLLIIVEEASGDTFQAIKNRAEETCQAVKEKGISCNLSQENLASRQLLIIDLNIPGVGPQKLIQFVESELFFNISFNARTEKKLRKHQQVMMQSIETIQLIDKQRTVDRTKEKEQMLAGSIRIAELMSNMGNRDYACRIIKDLLSEYPNNIKLRALNEKIGCK